MMTTLTVIKHFIISITIILFCIALPIFAQDEMVVESDEIVVNADKIPTTYADIARSIIVIHSDEIRNASVHNIQEFLEYTTGIDVKQRGFLGIQSDDRSMLSIFFIINLLPISSMKYSSA